LKSGQTTPLASWRTTTLEDGHENIINFRYLNNCASICCILSHGDIVLIKVESEIHEERIETIGNVAEGILAAEWTLDEEVLAIASSTASLIWLTQTNRTFSS
jgi:elongator complex protein 1